VSGPWCSFHGRDSDKADGRMRQSLFRLPRKGEERKRKRSDDGHQNPDHSFPFPPRAPNKPTVAPSRGRSKRTICGDAGSQGVTKLIEPELGVRDSRSAQAILTRLHDHIRRPIERHDDPLGQRELDSLRGLLPLGEPALGHELLEVEFGVDVFAVEQEEAAENV
jgi:hypothetical protein